MARKARRNSAVSSISLSKFMSQLFLLLLGLYAVSLLTCAVGDITGVSANLKRVALPYRVKPLDTAPMVSAKGATAVILLQVVTFRTVKFYGKPYSKGWSKTHRAATSGHAGDGLLTSAARLLFLYGSKTGFGNTLSTVFVVLAHVLWPYVFSYSGWTPAYVHPATFTVISVTVHLALTGPAIGVKFVKVRELAATFTAKALTAFVDTRGPVEACCVSLACVMHLALASSVWWLHSVSRYKAMEKMTRLSTNVCAQSLSVISWALGALRACCLAIASVASMQAMCRFWSALFSKAVKKMITLPVHVYAQSLSIISQALGALRACCPAIASVTAKQAIYWFWSALFSKVDGMELPTWLCASASSVFMTTTHSIMAAEQQLDALFKTHFNTLSGLVHKPSLTMPPSISTLVYSSFFFFTFTAVCLVCGVLWSAYGKTLSADSAAHATALPSLNAIDAIPSANAIATQNLLMAAVQAVIENLLKDKKTGRIVGVHRMPFFFSFLRAALSKTPHGKTASETFMKLSLELLPLLHNLEVSHRYLKSACQGSHLLEDIIHLASKSGLNSGSGIDEYMSSITFDHARSIVDYVQAVVATTYLQQAERVHPRVVDALPTEFKHLSPEQVAEVCIFDTQLSLCAFTISCHRKRHDVNRLVLSELQSVDFCQVHA